MKSGVATVVGHGMRLSIQLLGLVILGRILAPEDFGLIAMVGLLIALTELLRDFGLSTAALQARSLTDQQASNLFWTNLGLGTLVATAAVAVSPLWADLFGDPRLIGIVLAMSPSIIINSAQLQFQVQLARDHKFLALAVGDVFSQAVGLAAAAIAGLLGAGYWALTLQFQTVAIALLLSRYSASNWRPVLPRRNAGTRALINAGGNLGAAQLLSFVASNVDNLVIGLRAGPVVLGQYDRAFKLHAIPTAGLVGPLTNFAVPLLASYRTSKGSMHNIFLRMQTIVGTAFCFIFVPTAVVAEPLVNTLLGNEWQTAGTLLGILCLGGALQGLSIVNYWIYLHEAKSRELLKSNLITKTFGVILILAASYRGAEAVAWAYVAGIAATWVIATWYMGRAKVFEAKGLYSHGLQVLLPAAGTLCGATLLMRELPMAHTDPTRVSIGIVLTLAILVVLMMTAPAPRRELKEVLRFAVSRSVR